MIFDILNNKSYPFGKTWVYKIDFADKFFLGEEEVEVSRTSFFEKINYLSRINMEIRSYLLNFLI